jgi:hypothetical protein
VLGGFVLCLHIWSRRSKARSAILRTGT